MRKKLNPVDKRGTLIGIKVREETKNKIQFISKREARCMSTQINVILEEYIERYFHENQINWQEYTPRHINEIEGDEKNGYLD